MLVKPFVRLFKTKNNNYAYDVNSNDIVRMNDIAYDVMALLVSGVCDENAIIDLLQSEYDKEDLIRTVEQIQIFQKDKFLFIDRKPKEIDLFPNDEVWKKLYDTCLEQVTLEMTQRCNMRCGYCIYSDLHPEKHNFSDVDMPWDIAKTAMDYILVHGGKPADIHLGRNESNRDFTVGFYGGEPLLCFDMIERCVNYIKSKKEQNRNVHYTLTTNATLINDRIAKSLLDNNISVVVSLDGPCHIHNKMRQFPDGRGSYDYTLEGINRLQYYAQKMKPSEPIYASINSVVSGGFHWGELWDYFTSLESLLDTPSLSFITGFTPMSEGIEKWNLNHPETQISAPTGWDDLVQAYKTACIEGVYLTEGKVDWRYRVLHQFVFRRFYFGVHGRTRRQFCGNTHLHDRHHPGGICIPGQRRFYVRADGQIYPCERVPTMDPYFQIGDIKTGVHWEEGKRLFDDFTESCKDDCINCWIIRMCGEGCIKDITVGGVPNAEMRKNLCNQARNNRYFELEGLCQLLEVNPSALDHYNDIVVA